MGSSPVSEGAGTSPLLISGGTTELPDRLTGAGQRASRFQLVWEVQWDGRKTRFTVVLDATATAEDRARIERSDQELARGPKSRRKSRWPVRRRPRERRPSLMQRRGRSSSTGAAG